MGRAARTSAAAAAARPDHVDTKAVIFWATDARGQRTFFGEDWYGLTGQTEREASGLGWLGALDSEDRQRVSSALAEASRRRQPFSIDYRIRGREQTARWFRDVGRPQFEADGRWVGHRGAATNVDDLHDRIAALESREDLAPIVAEGSTRSVVVADARGSCVLANTAWLELTGYSSAEMRDAPLHDLVHHHHPDGRPFRAEDCPIHRALAPGTEIRDHEDVLFRRDGSPIAVVCAARTLTTRDGRPLTVLEVCDLTRSRDSEEAISRQAHHLALLWEAASIIVTAEDPDAMLQRLFARISGHLGIDAYIHFLVDGSQRTLRRASYAGIEDTGSANVALLDFGEGLSGEAAVRRSQVVATFVQQSEDPRAQLVRKLGFHAFAGYPLVAHDRLLGTLGFASRTRESFKHDELELLETISHYVAAAYEQERLASRLREADRRKDEFLAVLGHELRNPVAAITGAMRALRVRSDDSARRSLDLMERQLAQVTRLIDDLLDVSRIARGELRIRKSIVSLAEVVEDAVGAARPAIERGRHRFTVALPPEPVVLEADRARLAEVFSNLLGNAAKYTPEGGRIRLEAWCEGAEVVVSVKDDGIGIAPDAIERVFDKFVRLRHGPAGAVSGLGIGLSLVRSLTEMHGGEVSVYSEGHDRGSEFVIRLPRVTRRRLDSDRRPESPGEARRTRVLVVDDDDDVAEALAIAVQSMGHDVRVAHDGQEAIGAVDEFRPRIVLMDLSMPRMDGFEAARRIRASPWGRTVTLVALTGWAEESIRRRAHEAGFDDVLVKATDPTGLEAVLSGAGTEAGSLRSSRP